MDRRDQDCYFYYYSTCIKGDDCVFRHEPAALGCETICPHWQKRTCMNVHCNLRHMQLRKNRKLIPCYWENQPTGCRKPHCPFLHKYPRDHHQIVEPEKKECEQQGSTSQAPSNRGDRSRVKPQDNAQAPSDREGAAASTPRAGEKGKKECAKEGRKMVTDSMADARYIPKRTKKRKSADNLNCRQDKQEKERWTPY